MSDIEKILSKLTELETSIKNIDAKVTNIETKVTNIEITVGGIQERTMELCETAGLTDNAIKSMKEIIVDNEIEIKTLKRKIV